MYRFGKLDFKLKGIEGTVKLVFQIQIGFQKSNNEENEPERVVTAKRFRITL